MIAYLRQRIIYYGGIFLAIVLACFILFHMIPADPARTILGPNAGEAQVRALQVKMGLDQPLYRQVLHAVNQAVTFEFGTSHVDGRDIRDAIVSRIKTTGLLTGISLCMVGMYLIFVFMTFSTPLVQLGRGFDFLASSVPVFFSGILVAILTVRFYPVTSFSGERFFEDGLYLLPPALVLALYPMAILSKILLQEYENQKNALYVMSGSALGFSPCFIRFKALGKNLLVPLLSAFSSLFPMYITGAFIVEIIFSIPGISSLIVSAIMQQDFPMLKAAIVVNGLVFAVVNLGVECLYPLIDPRILKGNKA